MFGDWWGGKEWTVLIKKKYSYNLAGYFTPDVWNITKTVYILYMKTPLGARYDDSCLMGFFCRYFSKVVGNK